MLKMSLDMEKQKSIANKIKNYISKLPPDSGIPGIRKLAAEYNANFKTINKAIQLLIEEKFLYRIDRKGTFVRGSVDKNIQTIYMISPNFSNSNFLDYAIEARKLLSTCPDYSLMPFAIPNSVTMERLFIEKTHTIRGEFKLIRFPTYLPEEHHTRQILKEKKIETVIMNDFWFPENCFPSVQTNVKRTAFDAVVHLIENGHSEIIYLDSGEELIKGALSGYKDALKKYKIKFKEGLIISCENSYEPLLQSIINMRIKPTAIFSPYEQFSIQAINLLRINTLSVPGDISVISGEESFIGREIGLTAMAAPKKEMLLKCIDILFHKDTGKKYLFNSTLNKRNTVAERENR